MIADQFEIRGKQKSRPNAKYHDDCFNFPPMQSMAITDKMWNRANIFSQPNGENEKKNPIYDFELKWICFTNSRFFVDRIVWGRALVCRFMAHWRQFAKWFIWFIRLIRAEWKRESDWSHCAFVIVAGHLFHLRLPHNIVELGKYLNILKISLDAVGDGAYG